MGKTAVTPEIAASAGYAISLRPRNRMRQLEALRDRVRGVFRRRHGRRNVPASPTS